MRKRVNQCYNQGFTLVELMATLAILALVGLIVYPLMGDVLNQAEEQTDAISMEMTVDAARTAKAIGHPMDLENGYTLQSLVDGGYLAASDDSPLMNPSARVEKIGKSYEYYSEHGIGSRNLLLDSKSYEKGWSDTYSTYNQMWRIPITSTHDHFEVGDTITLSFDIQMERGTTIRIYDSNAHYGFRFGSKTFTNIGSERQRLSFTTELLEPAKTSGAWYFDIYNNNNGDRFIMENIMVTKGDASTEYRPAPEDSLK